MEKITKLPNCNELGVEKLKKVKTTLTNNPNKVNMTRALRKKISKILVKWGMPTIQIAISEIIELFEQEKINMGQNTKKNTLSWSEEFDKKFCRLDKSSEKKGRIDSWFLKDHIIGKDIKQFIKTTLKQEKKRL